MSDYSRNYYLEAYASFYSPDGSFDSSHCERFLVSCAHLQDLLHRSFFDLSALLGSILKFKNVPKKTEDSEVFLHKPSSPAKTRHLRPPLPNKHSLPNGLEFNSGFFEKKNETFTPPRHPPQLAHPVAVQTPPQLQTLSQVNLKSHLKGQSTQGCVSQSTTNRSNPIAASHPDPQIQSVGNGIDCIQNSSSQSNSFPQVAPVPKPQPSSHHKSQAQFQASPNQYNMNVIKPPPVRNVDSVSSGVIKPPAVSSITPQSLSNIFNSGDMIRIKSPKLCLQELAESASKPPEGVCLECWKFRQSVRTPDDKIEHILTQKCSNHRQKKPESPVVELIEDNVDCTTVN